jgi:hypothetical protein
VLEPEVERRAEWVFLNPSSQVGSVVADGRGSPGFELSSG